MLGRIIRAQERDRAARDRNRVVRPFAWGTEYLAPPFAVETDAPPRRALAAYADNAVRRSKEYFALPPVNDYRLADDHHTLTWTSAVETPSPENNIVRARFFPAEVRQRKGRRAQRTNAARVEPSRPTRAVVVLPQWNADAASHVDLCRLFARLGIAALRVTLPYHEERRPSGFERAEQLISSNVGRTLQSMRQAVIDTRAAVRWLREHAGFERVGIVGTSVGSCTAFLAFAHESGLDAAVFNHVSGYFADVVWRGISTRHVREGFGDAVTLEEARQYWLPISPFAFAPQMLELPRRPMRFIAARHDLTFPADLSRDLIDEVKRLGLDADDAWLPCGHYTLGERPWVYLDGWKIVTFIRKNL